MLNISGCILYGLLKEQKINLFSGNPTSSFDNHHIGKIPLSSVLNNWALDL